MEGDHTFIFDFSSFLLSEEIPGKQRRETMPWVFLYFFLIQTLAGAAKSCFLLDYLGNFFFFLFENTFRYRILKIELIIHIKYVHAVYIIA